MFLAIVYGISFLTVSFLILSAAFGWLGVVGGIAALVWLSKWDDKQRRDAKIE